MKTLESSRSSRDGFTLIELLVVIAIIAVLAALLVPALARGKAQARSIQCLGNLRQIGLSVHMFADEHDDSLPGSEHTGDSWVGTLIPYGGTLGTYRCPAEKDARRIYSYSINDFLLASYGGASNNFSRMARVPVPSETMLLGESAESALDMDHFHFADPEEGGFTPKAFAAQVSIRRHSQGANYLFVEGHVEHILWNRLKSTLQQPGSRLINPAGYQP